MTLFMSGIRVDDKLTSERDANVQRTHVKPKNRHDDSVPGLRGYAKIYKNKYQDKEEIHLYFLVSDTEGVARHSFSIQKYGFEYAYLLATEKYSEIRTLSALEEMDVLGRMPDKSELCSHMSQSLLARGKPIEPAELLSLVQ